MLMTRSSLIALITGVSRRELVDQLIMLEQTALADALCTLNLWVGVGVVAAC